MKEPGPNAAELQTILTAAARVPDHGKLFPWRFILFEGDARARMGEVLARALKETDPDAATPERLDMERARFLRAPVIVGVVSRVRDGIPDSAMGTATVGWRPVCQTMLIAATALGYVANWLTEWPAYNPRVAEGLGLGEPGERIAGCVYIGTSAITLEERVRPDLSKIVTSF